MPNFDRLDTIYHTEPTLFTEFDTIEIALQIVTLIELLHDEDLVHTNLSPGSIFLRDCKVTQMCFRDLYHCSWNIQETLHNGRVPS